MDLNKIKIKERVADENYDEFYRNYKNKNLREASKYLWVCIKSLVCALGLYENKEIKSQEEVIYFLNELTSSGEITKEEVDTIRAIHINFLRNTMDEQIFEIYRERTERLINKLKNILKDKIMSSGL